MTKIDEIRQKITELKAQAKIIGDNPNATFEEVQGIHNKLKVEYEKLKTEELIAQNKANPDGAKHQGADGKDKYKKALFNMLRNKRLTEEEVETIKGYNKLNTTTNEDGGYILPIDQETAIKELKKQTFSFRNYVTVEPVSTKTGTRVMEKNAEETPFAKITEGEEITDITPTPQFVQIKFDIADYAGILPVTNNLLNDTDVALEAYLNKWLAKKSNATENKIILDLIEKISSKTPVQLIEQLKNIRNTKLDMAFKPTTKFYMNSDAFNYFAEEKDANGRPMLEVNPKNPTERMIDGCPVVEVPNSLMKTTTNKAKIIIGDLGEFATLFDRNAITIETTKVGGSAWRNNTTELRAIIRLDAQKFDERAIQIAEVDISEPHTAGGVGA